MQLSCAKNGLYISFRMGWPKHKQPCRSLLRPAPLQPAVEPLCVESRLQVGRLHELIVL